MCYNNLYKDISFDFLCENCTRTVYINYILYKNIKLLGFTIPTYSYITIYNIWDILIY